MPLLTTLHTLHYTAPFTPFLRPPSGAEAAAMYEDGRKPNAAEKYGLVYVRGCEVGGYVLEG